MSKNILNKKILQVLPALESGGVERGTVDLATYGNENGYNIKVASSGGKMVEALEEKGVEHITLNLKSKNPLIIFANIFRLKRIIKEHDIKIVHARSRAPAWSAFLACKLSRTTFITTFHGFYQKNLPLKKFYNSVMARGDVVIAVSNFIKKHIIKNYNTGGKKIEVIHRGVNLKEFDVKKVTDEDIKTFLGKNGLNEKDRIIFLPGRITRWKGQNVAIKALSDVKDKKNIKLLIGGGWKGNDTYYQELVELCKDGGLENNVIFAGHISNMPVALRASDIALNTSVEPETFGRVSAEANAMGKPVIASAHGGSLEILENKECGVLVPPGEHKALAKAINELLQKLSTPENRDRIEELAINNVRENFSLELMCKKTLGIYDRFLNA